MNCSTPALYDRYMAPLLFEPYATPTVFRFSMLMHNNCASASATFCLPLASSR